MKKVKGTFVPEEEVENVVKDVLREDRERQLQRLNCEITELQQKINRLKRERKELIEMWDGENAAPVLFQPGFDKSKNPKSVSKIKNKSQQIRCTDRDKYEIDEQLRAFEIGTEFTFQDIIESTKKIANKGLVKVDKWVIGGWRTYLTTRMDKLVSLGFVQRFALAAESAKNKSKAFHYRVLHKITV